MMRGPSNWAVAVRTPKGEIAQVSNSIESPMKRHRLFRLPVVRGVVALGEALAIGFRALAISANYAAQAEDEEGEVKTEITRGQMIFAFAIAIGFAVLLFKVGPALITSRLGIGTTGVFVVVEGLIRVGIFIVYLMLISLLPDLRRVFQYHAAEHKAINAYEAGDTLEPERVQRYSLIHPRCGTAFLLWVMVIAIFVFALFGRPHWYWLIATRILLLPVIAGIAYELIRFAGKHTDNRVLMTLLAPGLWLQRLTTRQPTLDQIEVSVRALREVLDLEGRATPAERRVAVMASRSEVPSRPGAGRTRGKPAKEDGMADRGAERVAEVTWHGDLLGGEGAIERVGSGALGRLPISWAARTEQPDGKTSPEELIAAAHASCFSMAFAHGLAQAGTPPESMSTSARVTFVPGTGITRAALEVEATVPGMAEDAFREAAEQAKESCPVSAALRGNVEIALTARLRAPVAG